MSARLILVIVLMLVLGFAQEMLKVNINYYLDFSAGEVNFFERTPEERAEYFDEQKIYAPGDYYHSHQQLDLLHTLSARQIGMLKWGAALLFIGLNFALCFLALKYAGAAEMIRWLVYITTGAVVLALCFFLLSRMSLAPEPTYNIARKLLGFVQSPLPALILWFTSKLKSFSY